MKLHLFLLQLVSKFIDSLFFQLELRLAKTHHKTHIKSDFVVRVSQLRPHKVQQSLHDIFPAPLAFKFLPFRRFWLAGSDCGMAVTIFRSGCSKVRKAERTPCWVIVPIQRAIAIVVLKRCSVRAATSGLAVRCTPSLRGCMCCGLCCAAAEVCVVKVRVFAALPSASI